MNKNGTPQNLKNGRDRIWASGEELLADFSAFIEDIRKDGYKVAPTRTSFARWKGVDLHTLYLSVESYYPNIKKEFEHDIADVMSEGAMLGAYNPTMCIFCMKNWCGMTDKQEQKVDMTASVNLTVEDYFNQIDDGWDET